MYWRLTAPLLVIFATSFAMAQDKRSLAFVVNDPSDFWRTAEAGVARAQTELREFELLFISPERADVAIQQRMLQDLVASGVDSIMVSAVDPRIQTDGLKEISTERVAESRPLDAAGFGRTRAAG